MSHQRTGCLIWRKNGWYARVWVDAPDENGTIRKKRIWVSMECNAAKEDAKSKMDKLVAAISAGEVNLSSSRDAARETEKIACTMVADPGAAYMILCEICGRPIGSKEHGKACVGANREKFYLCAGVRLSATDLAMLCELSLEHVQRKLNRGMQPARLIARNEYTVSNMLGCENKNQVERLALEREEHWQAAIDAANERCLELDIKYHRALVKLRRESAKLRRKLSEKEDRAKELQRQYDAYRHDQEWMAANV